MTREQYQTILYYTEKLGITTPGEQFVLEHILQRDWNRDIILIDIGCLKYDLPNCPNLVWVECRTRSACYSFSVGHIENTGSPGWALDEAAQKQSVSSDLYHKLRA